MGFRGNTRWLTRGGRALAAAALCVAVSVDARAQGAAGGMPPTRVPAPPTEDLRPPTGEPLPKTAPDEPSPPPNAPLPPTGRFPKTTEPEPAPHVEEPHQQPSPPPLAPTAPREPPSPLPSFENWEPREPPRPRRHWYGWQTLLVDGASIGFLIAGSDSQSSSGSLIGIGVAGYFLGGPIVHLAHGHPGKAGGSLGLRVLPFVLLGAAFASCGRSGGEFYACDSGIGVMVLGILGFPAAIAVDAAAIAREDVPQGSAARLRLAPWVDARRGRGGLSLTGAF